MKVPVPVLPVRVTVRFPVRVTARATARFLLGAALSSLLLSALPACGDVPSQDVSLSDETIAPAAWELEWSPDELNIWRDGLVRHQSHGEQETDVGDLPVLPGARVELVAASPLGRLPLRVLDSATVGDDGRFRLGPGPDVEWAVRVSHPGLTTGLFGDAPFVPGVLNLAVESGLEVGTRTAHATPGRVVDADGSGVAGVTVRASSLAYFEEVVTAEDGSFTLGCPDGFTLVDIDDPAHGRERLPLTVPHQGTFEVLAPRRPPISGQVVHAVSGSPLAGAVVMHSYHSDLRTTTDADGRFTLAAPRTRHVVAFGRGMGWRAAPLGAHDADIVLALSPAAGVRGHVVGPDDQPVEGARLQAIIVGHRGLMEIVTGPLTDADGGFTFDWVPEPPRGSTMRPIVLARRRGLGMSAGLTVPDGGAAGVTLRLPGTQTVTGTLSRGSGETVPHVYGRAEWEPTGIEAALVQVLGVRTRRLWRSDESGRFTVRGLPMGQPIALSATLDGATVEWEHTGSGPADLELAGGHTVTGQIVDAAGEHLGPGFVTVKALDHPRYRGLTRSVETADGAFRVEDIPSGTYAVTAVVEGYLLAGAMCQADDADVRLIARRWATVNVHTEFPEGATAERTVVRLQALDDAAERPRVATVPADGDRRVQVTRVRSGRYRVVAAGGRWRGRIEELDVADGATVDVTVPVRRTLSLLARMREADGTVLAGSRLRVHRVGAASAGVETFWTDEDGRVEVTGLAPGEWEIRALLDGRPPLTQRVTLGREPPGELELEIPAHGVLRVQLTGDPASSPDDFHAALESTDGKPIAAWSTGASRLASRFRFDADGRLALRGVLAGSVVLRIRGPSGDLARQEVTVPAGGEAELELP